MLNTSVLHKRWMQMRLDNTGETLMEKSGRVVGVCISQKRADPKKNVGKAFLQKGLGFGGGITTLELKKR